MVSVEGSGSSEFTLSSKMPKFIARRLVLMLFIARNVRHVDNHVSSKLGGGESAGDLFVDPWLQLGVVVASVC